MKTLTPNELREAWYGFFEERGHARHPSDGLVPENDPTLLFTGAGMNQFKDMFVGKGNLPHKRVTTIQKCFRQGDLENVGKTPRHLTFFEMLGHFSFGDYFKSDAIPWAWQFLTEVLEIPPEKLWVSVYDDDPEAYDLWKGLVPEARIGRFDAKENFWPADAPEKGPNGVCGPCSEIFYDYGPSREIGDGGSGGFDSGRFIEIWNTVFTQFDRRGVNELEPLPQKNIDCGAGFERIVAVLEDQYSPFGTSLFRGIIEQVAKISGKAYDFAADDGLPQGDDARRARRIAEHARAACMLIADGVRPSNEGRGYVLRRILRRAIRDGFGLGIDRPFLQQLVAPVIAAMGDAYPGLEAGQATLEGEIGSEEARFRVTYGTGRKYLDEEVEKLGSVQVLPGAVAFKLHDTYGFPLDLAEAILAERGLSVDVAGFDREMEAQRERARAGSKIAGEIFAGGPLTELKAQGREPTVFLGYDDVQTDATVIGIILGDGLVDSAPEGVEATLVLDRTPFYGESGGQVGDVGEVAGEGCFRVEDTLRREGFFLHRGRVAEGVLSVGEKVVARVDTHHRDAIRRNHTATHLLHKVLKDVLGGHVQQEGSMVAASHLRFDFRHDGGVTPEQIDEIEARVNRWILLNEPVATEVLSLEEARASGAVAMFGEKYADTVRVLDVPGGAQGTSRELCGGTHCVRVGDIGSFRITVETSIAAGIRRLEGVTGEGAVAAFEADRRVIHDLGQRLKVRPDELLGRVEALQTELKSLHKAQEKAAREAGAALAGRLVDDAPVVDGLAIQVAAVPGVDAKGLKGVWDTLKNGGVTVGLLIGEQGGKAPILAACTKEAMERGLDAKALLGAATGVLGGGGGGRPQMAQGQGQDRSRIEAAIEAVREAIEGVLRAG